MSSAQHAADVAHAEYSAARAKLLHSIAALRRTKTWDKKTGAANFPAFLAARWNISPKTARELVREAEALAELPMLSDACLSGRVSVDECKALLTLCEPGTNDERIWLKTLPSWDISDMEREARKKRARELDRDDGGIYHRMRYTEDERYMKGDYQVRAEDGAVLQATLDAMIAPKTPYAELDRASAYALVALAKGAAPSRPPTVLVSIESPQDVARIGDAYVGAETAKRLSCEAVLQPLYKDASGVITGYGRTTRTVPPPLRRAVYERDHGACTFPGCGNDFFLECHHIIHWEDGGPTELYNLLLLCWNHHEFLHEGGWSVRGPAGPGITWLRPDGAVYDPRVRVTLDTS